MSTSPIEYLRHMLDECVFLSTHAHGLTQETFLQDMVLKRAFVRSLEIIGEATRNLPEDFRRKYSSINWREIGGMRNRLIHAYFSVDYDIVWDAVTNDIPDLQQQLELIITSESAE